MDEKKELIVVGATTKLGNFAFKSPFKAMLILICAFEFFTLMAGNDTRHLLRGLWLLLTVCLPLIVGMYLMGNKWCYKIEINRPDNSIIFYRLLNRGVDTFLIDKIKIVIGAYCHIFIGSSEFILHDAFIHDLASYLPKDTVIEYKGVIGKSKETHWENGPLIPGNKV